MESGVIAVLSNVVNGVVSIRSSFTYIFIPFFLLCFDLYRAYANLLEMATLLLGVTCSHSRCCCYHVGVASGGGGGFPSHAPCRSRLAATSSVSFSNIYDPFRHYILVKVIPKAVLIQRRIATIKVESYNRGAQGMTSGWRNRRRRAQ